MTSAWALRHGWLPLGRDELLKDPVVIEKILTHLDQKDASARRRSA